MNQQTGEYYFSIFRNGAQIPDTEYALIRDISTRADWIEHASTATIQFGITNSGTSNNQQKDYFDVMKTYIFSKSDTYKILMGKNEADASNNVFFGIVTNVSVSFPEDGDISFSATLGVGISSNPEANQDQLRSYTWDPNVSAYKVLDDSVTALGKKLLITQADYAKLSSYTHVYGISRPAHQSTKSWLNQLSNNYGIFLDDQGANVYVRKLNLKTQPKLYFVYRATTAADYTQTNYGAGTILSFEPELDKPPIFTGTGIGTNPTTGQPATGQSNPNANNDGPNQYQLNDVGIPQSSAATALDSSGAFTVPTAPQPLNNGSVPVNIPNPFTIPGT